MEVQQQLIGKQALVFSGLLDDAEVHTLEYNTQPLNNIKSMYPFPYEP